MNQPLTAIASKAAAGKRFLARDPLDLKMFEELLDDVFTVSVRDHGVGLPEGDSEQIFSHFFTTKPNGMGMGLTIVHSIVEAHGGELGAENVEGGARVSFSLPTA